MNKPYPINKMYMIRNNRQCDVKPMPGRGFEFDIASIKLVFFVLFISVSLLSFSTESKLKKWYGKSDFDKILSVINSNSSSQIKNVDDYLICGETAFRFGMYKKSDFYYSQARKMGIQQFSSQDIVNWGFVLLQLEKNETILSDTLFERNTQDSKWIQQIRQIAVSRNDFRQKRDSLVESHKLLIDIVPEYGISLAGDNSIFYSFPVAKRRFTGDLSESNLINKRKNELAGIKKIQIDQNGKPIEAAQVYEKEINGFSRIAGLNPLPKEGDFVATVVSQKGKPEQIIIKSSIIPSFPYNSSEYACAMPFLRSSDNRLFFCSTMPGGIGGWDIYYCDLDNGKWTEPVNMGDKINTPFDELFPSVYKNFLVFSSEAHEGLGGFDNYIFSLDDNSLQNLWPLNTPEDDLSLRLIDDVQFKALGVRSPVAMYYSAECELESLLNPQLTKENQVSSSSEEQVFVPQEKSAPEKLNPDNDEPSFVLIPKDKSGTERTSFVLPEKIDKNSLLGNIYYDLNSAIFKSEHYAILESVIQKIKENKLSNIVIWGYTDLCGAERYNANLSLQRALGVVEYMKSRLSGKQVYFTIAAGEYFSNAGKAINEVDRRTEIYSSNQILPYKISFAYKPVDGEDAKSISKLFNNDYEQLQELNQSVPENRINDSIIYVGIQGIHVVSPGETVSLIARKYQVTTEQLLRINKKNTSTILIGEKLILPLPKTNK